MGARGIKDQMQLSDLFFKSVILGVNRVAKASGFKKELVQAAGRYVPSVARKITESTGVTIGPIGLASDLSENGIKWLIKHVGYTNIAALLGSKNLDSQQAATLLVDKLEDEIGELVFI